MKKNLKVVESVDLGPTDVALVWDGGGGLSAYISNADLAQAMPDHVLEAFAVMLSMDDMEIKGRMWEKLENRMDVDLARHPEQDPAPESETAAEPDPGSGADRSTG